MLAARHALAEILDQAGGPDDLVGAAWHQLPWLQQAEPPAEFTDAAIGDLFTPRPASGWNDDPFGWATTPP